MQTGENDQAMRKILDMTRLISLAVLLLHFYETCYGAFAQWHWVSALTDRLLANIVRTGLFSNFLKPKLIADDAGQHRAAAHHQQESQRSHTHVQQCYPFYFHGYQQKEVADQKEKDAGTQIEQS